MKDLVLVGGGHAHVYILKNFGMKPLTGVRITLITRDVETPYSGMIPGHIAGMYTREECHIDLARMARFAGAVLIHGEATAIDRSEKVVYLKDGRPPVPYDVLSINIGSTPRTMDFSTATVPVTPVKPIDGFARRWDAILDRALATTDPFVVAVVGGGAGGVEVCLSMQVRVADGLLAQGKAADLVSFVLVTHTPNMLPSHNRAVQRKFSRIFRERGVRVVVGTHVIGVEGKEMVCENGTRVTADEVVWCTQAGTPGWLQDTGLDLLDGFIAVDDYLQSRNTRDVFAVGDCAVMVNYPRPRAGVFAVRQGPPLAANLRHTLCGEPLEPYEPQSEFLGLIGTGRPSLCVASKGPMALEGAWLWDLKDWIDRKWMASYSTGLPIMTTPDPAASAVALSVGSTAVEALKHANMRCGGCGSKVGSTALSRVLARLQLPPKRPEVLVGLDSPDDCALVRGPGPGIATVHTVDFFRAFITDPFVFGKIAANHALSDIDAMGGEAVSALAIVVVPFGLEAKMEQLLLQVHLAGCCSMSAEASAL